jgi:hypothetical protein
MRQDCGQSARPVRDPNSQGRVSLPTRLGTHTVPLQALGARLRELQFGPEGANRD